MKVNYILHQIALFERIYEDDRLNPTHISLYMALFQYWNLNRFNNPFRVSRSEIMKLSKINSRSTYSKCIHDLVTWLYIEYFPSNHPLKGSQFSLLNLTNSCTKNEQAKDESCAKFGLPMNNTSPLNGPLLVPYKTYKQKDKNSKAIPQSELEVIHFFNKEKSTELEAKKFWNHYESIGWKSGHAKIQNWQASAKKWILSNLSKPEKGDVQNLDNSFQGEEIKYDEPL